MKKIVKVSPNDLYKGKDDVFNEFKFISALYECEKKKKILVDRINQIDNEVKRENYIPEYKNSIYFQKQNKETKKLESDNTVSLSFREDIFNVFTSGMFFATLPAAGIGIIRGIHKFFKYQEHGFFKYLFSGLFQTVLWAAGLILGVVLLIYLFTLINNKIKYNKTKKINSKIIEFNNEIADKYKKEYERYVYNKKKNLVIFNKQKKSERALAYQQYENVCNTLKTLYNLRYDGVLCIHPNYQGLIPVSVIYGYFDTGRCSQLKGHEGAYNLYEDERIKGMIINKLDAVAAQINNLNSTMSYVASAIQECNSNLNELQRSSKSIISSLNSVNSNISNVSEQMSDVNNNTANAAYYTKIGAEMATFNTFYNYYK